MVCSQGNYNVVPAMLVAESFTEILHSPPYHTQIGHDMPVKNHKYMIKGINCFNVFTAVIACCTLGWNECEDCLLELSRTLKESTVTNSPHLIMVCHVSWGFCHFDVVHQDAWKSPVLRLTKLMVVSVLNMEIAVSCQKRVSVLHCIIFLKF